MGNKVEAIKEYVERELARMDRAIDRELENKDYVPEDIMATYSTLKLIQIKFFKEEEGDN